MHFNGGFGRADPLTPTDLSTSGDVSALAASENELLERAAGLGDDALAKLVGHGSHRRVWRPVGLDAEGLDLSRGGEVARVDFAAPAHEPEAWWEALRARAGSSER